VDGKFCNLEQILAYVLMKQNNHNTSANKVFFPGKWAAFLVVGDPDSKGRGTGKREFISTAGTFLVRPPIFASFMAFAKMEKNKSKGK
jgi:hypothetical protein